MSDRVVMTNEPAATIGQSAGYSPARPVAVVSGLSALRPAK
jgi:hypothetical protein